MRHIHIYQFEFIYTEPISQEVYYIYKCLYCHKKIAYLGSNKSEAVEILKEFFKELAKAYMEQLKMIEEYTKLKAKQRKRLYNREG